MSEFEFDAPDIDVPNIDTDISDLSDTPTDGLEDVAETPDVPDDDFYHAKYMSDEEVKRIDEMWDDAKDCSDVEPYKAISLGELSDIEDVTLTDEEQFAAKIEAMSLDDLQAERDRLEELSKMSDMDIFADYDEQVSGMGLEQFGTAIEGMSAEQLADLRDDLEAHDPATLEYFGIEDDGANDNQVLSLRKKL